MVKQLNSEEIKQYYRPNSSRSSLMPLWDSLKIHEMQPNQVIVLDNQHYDKHKQRYVRMKLSAFSIKYGWKFITRTLTDGMHIVCLTVGTVPELVVDPIILPNIQHPTYDEFKSWIVAAVETGPVEYQFGVHGFTAIDAIEGWARELGFDAVETIPGRLTISQGVATVGDAPQGQ